MFFCHDIILSLFLNISFKKQFYLKITFLNINI
ncbi:hypothetical protein cco74_03892 [Campylobacter coli 37/05]|uniref:Uncharacterized protein n=1 Tax=Campylobacter coli 80352 TaxID=887288 RepID=A0ABN0ERG6_CAMCO